jgi:hypothetical protein
MILCRRRLTSLVALAATTCSLAAQPESSQPELIAEGRIRTNYGAQTNSNDSFAGPPEHNSTLVNRLLQAIVRVEHGAKEMIFDGYVRQDDGRSWDTSGSDTTINQLFASLRFGGAYKLKVGRQRALWGHGFVYVPTDFINPPLDPAGLDLANARGVDSVTLDLYRGQSTLTLIHNFDRAADREGYGLKLTDSSLENIDWNLIYYHAPQTGHAGGFTFSTDPAAWFYSSSDGSLNLFANFALRERSFYFKPLDRSDGQLRQPDNARDNQPFFTYLLGLAHEASQWSLSTRMEYYFIEDAYRTDELKAIYSGLRDNLPVYFPWIDRLAYGRSQRHYVNFSIGQSSITQGSDSRFANTFGYGLGALHGLNDHSTLYSLSFVSSYFDRAEIELTTLVPDGGSRSEFGTTPFKWRMDFSISLIF